MKLTPEERECVVFGVFLVAVLALAAMGAGVFWLWKLVLGGAA